MSVIRFRDMSEIKFRQAIFRDGVFNHWHYWGYVGHRGTFVAPIEIEQESFKRTYDVKDSQQFTGFRCGPVSLGSRIYEGDRVKNVMEGTAVFEDGRFLGKTDKGSTFYLGESKYIGNVHENPELFGETSGS